MGVVYVVMNVLTARDGAAADLEAAFAGRARRLAQVPGFAGYEFLRRDADADAGADGPGEYVVMTHWADEAAYRAWVGSDAFRASHRARDARPAGESPAAASELRTYTVLESEGPPAPAAD